MGLNWMGLACLDLPWVGWGWMGWDLITLGLDGMELDCIGLACLGLAWLCFFGVHMLMVAGRLVLTLVIALSVMFLFDKWRGTRACMA